MLLHRFGIASLRANVIPALRSLNNANTRSVLNSRCGIPFTSRNFSLSSRLSKELQNNGGNEVDRKTLASRTRKVIEKSRQDHQALKVRIKEQSNKIKHQSQKLKEQSKTFKENINKIIPPEVHENIYTIPNILTFTRLVSAPVIGYLIVYDKAALALSLFVYSCITDFVDGYIARKYNLKSVLGSIIDPLADKSLMVICTICLAKTAEIPLYLATLILGRDILLALAAVVIRYTSLPEPKTFFRYWDFSIPSAEVHPTMISKVNTALQMVYIGCMMVKPVFVTYMMDFVGMDIASVDTIVNGMEIVVASTTILSGLSYVFSKNAVKILTKTK